MGFSDAIKSGFSNYVNIEGRAPRSAYWYWFLFLILGGIVAGIMDSIGGLGSIGGNGALSSIFELATLIPSITLGVRRFHDLGKSGWWMLLILVPVIGWLIMLFFFVQAGNTGANEYGADPLAGS